MKKGHVPIRTCRGCGRRVPQAELVRFVVMNGIVWEDGEKTMPGRGVYCCRNAQCQKRFDKKRKMQRRSFRLHA
ncbi:MAG: DUF448 domain-containing protein [Desulfobulbus sp.]|nr:MAG: DUF448 domain-containing protein [Desulfobulbus sp.]RUM37914.1 MAG: DUF448 domain-containing protein [Desulfobulbus sp.]